MARKFVVAAVADERHQLAELIDGLEAPRSTTRVRSLGSRIRNRSAPPIDPDRWVTALRSAGPRLR